MRDAHPEIFMVVGAFLVAVGFAGAYVNWQEYWLRTQSPSLGQAVQWVIAPILTGVIGAVVLGVGIAHLRKGLPARYLIPISVVVLSVLLAVFLLMRIL